eukprot:2755758-Prymnesium_polylepis.1
MQGIAIQPSVALPRVLPLLKLPDHPLFPARVLSTHAHQARSQLRAQQEVIPLLIETSSKDSVAHDRPLLDHAECLLDRTAEVALLLVHLGQQLSHLRLRLPQVGRVRRQHPRLVGLHVQRGLEHAIKQARVVRLQVRVRVAINVRHVVRRRIVLASLDAGGAHHRLAEKRGEQQVALPVALLRVVRLVLMAIVRVPTP